MVFVSVDCEASGQYPPQYSLLSIGACDVHNISNTFYAELAMLNDNISGSAMRVVGDLWQRCIENGQSPTKVMTDFNKWLESFNERVIFVAFNLGFDWTYIQFYFHEFLGYNPFGISGLDIKAYAMGKLNCEWSETTKKKLKGRIKWEGKHTHNALQDSVEQANLFRRLLEI